MSLYVMGDLHLSFSTDKPMGIFGEIWDNHAEKIKERWPLDQNDTIIINGDISWAMTLEEAAADFEFLESLPGKKILLKGNHDYWWSTYAKLIKFAENYPSLNFLYNNTYETDECFICGTRGWILEPGEKNDVKVSLREAGRLRLSLRAYTECRSNKKVCVFLHYPPIFGNIRNIDILEVLEEFGIERCFYGHLHGQDAHKNAFTGKAGITQMYLTSSDYLDFKPLLIG